jgi:hypothetical protein
MTDRPSRNMLIDDATYRAAMHPVRLRVLIECSGTPQTRADLDLAGDTGLRHLRVLVDARLLRHDERAGTYKAMSDWRPLAEALEAVASSGPPLVGGAS